MCPGPARKHSRKAVSAPRNEAQTRPVENHPAKPKPHLVRGARGRTPREFPSDLLVLFHCGGHGGGERNYQPRHMIGLAAPPVQFDLRFQPQ